VKKRFIVLIDFSEYSNNLVSYAGQWCKKVDAAMVLVHQLNVVTPSLADKAIRHQLASMAVDEAQQKLAALAVTFIPSSVKVTYSATENPLSSTLANFLAEPFDHLIFVGLKGTGMLKKILVGSTALDIINSTKDIVVALPKEVVAFSPEKVFVAVSEKHPLNTAALDKCIKLMKCDHIMITFFYLAKPHEKTDGMQTALNNFSSQFADSFATNTAIYEGNNPFEDIKLVVNNKMNEMLIVQKGSRLLTDQLFRKFLINELVYEGQTPLIVLP